MHHQRTEDFGELRMFIENLWRIIQSLVALGALYAFAAHVINSLLAGQSHMGAIARWGGPTIEALEGGGIRLPLPEGTFAAVTLCLIIGFVTRWIVEVVCSEQWVQEPVNIKSCFEKIKWYNPWSWIKTLVCTIVQVLKWVLKIVCKYITVAIVILVVTCIVVVLFF